MLVVKMDYDELRPDLAETGFPKAANCTKLRLKNENVSVSIRCPGLNQQDPLPLVNLNVSCALFKARYIGMENKNSLLLRPIFTPVPIDISFDPLNGNNLRVLTFSRIQKDENSPVWISVKASYNGDTAQSKGGLSLAYDSNIRLFSQCEFGGKLLPQTKREPTVAVFAGGGCRYGLLGFRVKAQQESLWKAAVAVKIENIPFLKGRVWIEGMNRNFHKFDCDGALFYRNFVLSWAASRRLHWKGHCGLCVNSSKCRLKFRVDTMKNVVISFDFFQSKGRKIGISCGTQLGCGYHPKWGLSYTASE